MSKQWNESTATAKGLYDPRYEHDNCGIGAVVNIKGIKTHETVENALKIVENLKHRAGKDADGKTGDGVGILLQISHKFFKKVTKPLGIELGDERDYGVGMFFFPNDEFKTIQAKKMLEVIVEKEGLEFLGWREVPTEPDKLSKKARDCMPCIMQCFVKRPEDVERGLEFDRKLYVARRVFEQSNDNTYVVSFSSRTIVYKGMFLVEQLRQFFMDLQDPDYESAIATVHSRFSTNTNPSWERSHPNRFIVHNGEINTILGNSDKMSAREENMESPKLKKEFQKVLPVINAAGSDSAMLDNALEFLVMSGMELPLAVMIMIPEPWANNSIMTQKKKDFYQYYATMMEPWDGPASIVFSDGDLVGAVLDRNGLRPSRYYVTDDDYLILSSEVGVLEIDPTKIVKKDRLRPGKMLLVDTVAGKIIDDDELKERYADKQPYGEWIDRYMVNLKDLKIPNQRVPEYTKEERQRMQRAFGYTYESLKDSILPMAKNGVEGTAAMGTDTPLAALSGNREPLFNYFKQRFAQVTNPPIDSIREEVVTSTTLYIGEAGNVLEEKPENCRVLKINNPILTNTDLMKIKNLKADGFKVEVLPIIYYKNTSLEKAVDRLYIEADRAYRDGANIIILSDRGVDENHVAIPSLLAVAALQQYLVKTKKRTSLSLILESGEPREVHHFATLLGFGASAINPYLAQDTVKQLVDEHMLDKDYYAAIDDYNHAIITGIVKIAAKMGISTIQSYQGSKIFEAIGIDKSVIDKYFTNTVSRIGGITLQDIENDVNELHSAAYDPLGLETDVTLDSKGRHKMRSGADDHLYNPATIHLLQQSTQRGDYNLFKQYTALVDEEEKNTNIRGLMDFNYPKKGVKLEEVESVDSIVTRFKTGAMSYGSISKEAHETLAIAMNHLHGKSNTGEGGEDKDRLTIGKDGKNRCSAIKQVASGRFGVTSRYLTSAQEIQIKMAQGAKPGEGGHLPGKKVYPWIAKTRLSTPGVALISPPPHHDIYSIEDLEQLIFDLKNANRDARISVKLVSEAGVGTVAAGVAKAGAQVVLISGYDGGTGAAPSSSIHNAGLPWELGLSEAQQVLLLNQLRDRVKLETDGKLLTGRDAAIACLLGAELFSFCTGPLIAIGCQMFRVCNKNTCPFGICTQDEKLRKRFAGKPEYVMNYMRFVAEDLREIMAHLGFHKLEDMVGRSDRLKQKSFTGNKKADTLSLDALLFRPYTDITVGHHFMKAQDHEIEKTLDMAKLVRMCKPALDEQKRVIAKLFIKNTDRVTGTILGSEISRRYGDEGLPEDTISLSFVGSAGQSFGAFIPKGLTLTLEGDANDYVGKGLSGGKIIIYPPREATFRAEDNVIIGNVAFFGATSGEAFVSGKAGERFCVRNSGATVVVEGIGNHGCEYMTGGKVIILGETGKNFAAGMSGGVAYVLDLDERLCNQELIHLEPLTDKEEIAGVKKLIDAHYLSTRSRKAESILARWDVYYSRFTKVIPKEYEAMEEAIRTGMAEGLTREEAIRKAYDKKFGK